MGAKKRSCVRDFVHVFVSACACGARENNLIEQSSRNNLVVLKACQLRVELGRIAGDVDDLVILFRELERS